MSLRIGFDMDGVLADLATAYRDVERLIFGPEAADDDVPESPEETAEADAEVEEKADDPFTKARAAARGLREQRRRRLIVWHAIETTRDFWTTLAPIEPGLVKRLAEAAARHRWEVFFITQRPETDGDTAQRQTQRWLVAQGFDLPSVVVARGARGKLADALGLDYLVDDTPRNCVDVVADSKTRVLLVSRSDDSFVADSARKLRVAVVDRASAALDILEQATAVRANPKLLERLARLVGWGRDA